MNDSFISNYMKAAIEEAKKGQGFANPNPLVGAVLVKNGTNIYLAVVIAFIVGCLAGLITGIFHTFFYSLCCFPLEIFLRHGIV